MTQPTSIRPTGIRREIVQLPLFLQLFGVSAVSMLLPSIYGLVVNDHQASRAFLYAGVLGLVAFTLIAIAHAGRKPLDGALGPLLSLLSAFVFLPVFFAIPFLEALPTTRFVNVYFEMVSALTTTGATMFENPARLSNTLHLWRAQVGWMGGLLMWVTASAILAPLHLGGFEVTAQAEPGRPDDRIGTRMGRITPRQRLLRTTQALLPIYTGLTLLLWLLLVIGGETAMVALCHAMSVLATSGISPVGGVDNAQIGVSGEAVMMLFMLFALSRLTFSKDTITATQGGLMTDPEFRIGLLVVIGLLLVEQS